jgi:pimeloyl-ACP methyl ester carboxylesterase
MRLKARVVCLGRSNGPDRSELFSPPNHGFRWPSKAMARIIACALMGWGAIWWGTPAAEADPAVRVFAIRGVAGLLFSRGMNALCDELTEFASVTCTVEDFTEVAAIESEARAASAAGAHVVLVGHSMGADAAIEIATQIAGPVAVVAAIDPPRFRVRPVPDNVAVVLNYYQRIDFFGRGEVSTVAGFKGRVTRVERDEPHIMIDRDPEIHAAIIAEIVNLLP